MPVSSSGHLVMLGSRDKTFEVFLHAGTAVALVVALRSEVLVVTSELDRRRLARILLTLAPAALAGVAFESTIERRLGRRAVAVAQAAGGVALLVADRAPARRSHSHATTRDAVLIGLAQACALAPGVSRNGATLTAARLLGFRRSDASRMSRHAALPVIAGATALKLLRLVRGPAAAGAAPSPGASRGAQYAAGAAAAFVSSLAAARLVPLIDRLDSYAPFAIYRIALAGLLFSGRSGEKRPGSRLAG